MEGRVEHLVVPIRELKSAATDGAMRFSGYASVFGNTDYHGDVIAPGAFADFLALAKKGEAEWPVMMLQHGALQLTADDMMPIGVWDTLAEDGVGLFSEGTLAPTTRGKDVHVLMSMQPRPAITGLSVGFIAKASTPRSKPDEPRRTITKAHLIEISPVTFPANTRARVTGVKSLDQIMSLSDAEAFLREVGGLSKSAATAFIARVKAATVRGEPDPEPEELSAILAGIQRNASLLSAR